MPPKNFGGTPRSRHGRSEDAVPVVLFAFNRPEHTRRVLEGLAKNEVQDLHVFVDGPRHRFDEPLVDEVHRVLGEVTWTEPVVHSRDENLGLARSILRGVDEIMVNHSEVIVLEDDCVPKEGFYAYMTDALGRYRGDDRVGCVSGFGPPISRPDEYPFDGYFTDRMSSWGWGTWQEAWELRESHWESVVADLSKEDIDYDKIGRELERYMDPAEAVRIGRDVWTPLWLFPLYLARRQTLWPFGSYIRNIGRDGSGTNSGRVIPVAGTDPVLPSKFRFPDPSRKARDERVTRNFVRWCGLGDRKSRLGPFEKLGSGLRRKPWASALYNRTRDILGLMPRHAAEADWRLEILANQGGDSRGGSVDLPFGRIEYVNATTLRRQYREIFLERRYAFGTSRSRPRILDCGANIGLSSIWLARNYPGCRLTAFEADPGVLEVLERNLARHTTNEVDMVPKAVGTKSGKNPFHRPGDDPRRILRSPGTPDPGEVEAVRLSDLIEERVDFLKLTLEGAEFEVLEDLSASGALGSIDRLVCELHVLPETQESFVSIQSVLDENGIAFVIRFVRPMPETAGRTWQSPFSICSERGYRCLLYAWRPEVLARGRS